PERFRQQTRHWERSTLRFATCCRCNQCSGDHLDHCARFDLGLPTETLGRASSTARDQHRCELSIILIQALPSSHLNKRRFAFLVGCRSKGVASADNFGCSSILCPPGVAAVHLGWEARAAQDKLRVLATSKAHRLPATCSYFNALPHHGHTSL